MKEKIVLPLEDIGAKLMFNEEIVRKCFISAALKIPLKKIRSARLVNSHLLRRFRNDKEGIVDIEIELNDDTIILIEIQVAEYQCWDGRSLYYLSKAFIDTISRGQDYSKLKRCISINVLDFNLLQTGNCHTEFKWRDAQGNGYTDLQEIHIIEINKETEQDPAIREWVELFRCRKKEELEMLKARTENPGIRTAIDVLREMSLSKMIKAEWDYRQKQWRDRRAREGFVYDQGKAEGIEQGIVAMIDMCQKLGYLKETTILTIRDKFSLSEDKAKAYVDKFWK